MRNRLIFSVPALLAISAGAFAAAAPTAVDYRTVPAAGGGTGITFQIGYTFGTHKGNVTQVDGVLHARTGAGFTEFDSAHFVIPIQAMGTGDVTRDCHMVESLGLDYAGGKSQFPREHVCDAKNQVPASGPDSVAFPTIDFELKNFRLASGDQPPNQPEAGKTYSLLVQGIWKIHGRTVDLGAQKKTLPIQVRALDATGRRIHVTGSFPIVLADFGIVVKKAGPVGVADFATVKLDLDMAAPASTP